VFGNKVRVASSKTLPIQDKLLALTLEGLIVWPGVNYTCPLRPCIGGLSGCSKRRKISDPFLYP